jgi:hypothetical protein
MDCRSKPGNDRGARCAAGVPRRLQLGRKLDGADEQVHLGPCARLCLVQYGARDELGAKRAAGALLYSSDYPHWDFDLPSTIYDLPFLKEKAKRDILGGNAVKLFNIDINGKKLAKVA